MAPKRNNLAFRLVMIPALVAIVLAAAVWAASTLAKNNAVPASTDAIYRAQFLNLF